jgi:hypothetical protein
MQKKEKQFSSHVQQLTSNSHETSLCAFTKKELNCNNSCIQKYLTVKPFAMKTTKSRIRNRGESVRKVGPFLLTESTQRDRLQSAKEIQSTSSFNCQKDVCVQ